MSKQSEPTNRKLELHNVVDFDTITNKFEAIHNGEEDAFDTEVQTAVVSAGKLENRSEFEDWFNALDGEMQAKIQDILISAEKETILSKIHNKITFIESTDYKKNHKIVRDLSLSEISYYSSYFKFSHGSMNIFEVPEMDPLLKRVSEEAETREEAQDLFADLCEEHMSSDYAGASNNTPLPLVGDLQTKPKPRLVRFEKPSQVYLELWSYGQQKSIYHPERGETLNFQSRARSQVRIYIDKGIIEYTSTRGTKGHEKTDRSHLEENFSFGTQDEEKEILSKLQISSDNIWDVIENIGVYSTLESFEATNAKISYSSVNKRDVKKGPSRDDVKRDTKLQRANIQILINDPGDSCEFIEPEYIFSQYSFDDDDNIKKVAEELREMEGLNDLISVTVSLHAKNNTIQIDKDCRPSTRTNVFNRVINEIGW